jgi:hypothetical protein
MRQLFAIAVLGLALAVSASATADALPAPHAAPAKKKCFKRKHGKRVRVKCPKKKQPSTPAPAPPAPASPAPSPLDAALAQQAGSALTGQMLHHFSTSAGAGSFQGDEILHLCSGGRYKYLAQLYLASAGLFGSITDELGTWRVTGAQQGPNGSTIAGLLFLPQDGSPPHFQPVMLVPTIDGFVPYLQSTRWYLGPSTLCA